jgi:hypothetical protein
LWGSPNSTAEEHDEMNWVLVLADFEVTPERVAISALTGCIVFLFGLFWNDSKNCQKKHDECEEMNTRLFAKVEVLRELLSQTGTPLSRERLEHLAGKKVDELRSTLSTRTPASTEPRLA